MGLLVTDAVVLHAFDYLETSRILRLATREAGVQSVIARGARRPKGKFGSALDLFAEGVAQIHIKPGRELQTLGAFDVAVSRPALGADLGRFTAANAIAELMLRFVREDRGPAIFDLLRATLDEIAGAERGGTDARLAAIAGAWRLIAELGFAPSVDDCGECHAPVPSGEPALFSHPAGGVLCPRCARRVSGSRTLPPAARTAIRHWLAGDAAPLGGERDTRAHQRLLREFLGEHLTDGRTLRAFDVWEYDRLGSG